MEEGVGVRGEGEGAESGKDISRKQALKPSKKSRAVAERGHTYPIV